MTLDPGEFIRRFLLHVLPKGFHRIRHYGLLASAGRKANIARARELLAAPQPKAECSATEQSRCRSLTRLAAAMSVLWRQDDHHRDLRARRQRPRAAVRRLDKRSPNAMTATRPSPRITPAEGPHRRRMAGFVRLRPPTRTYRSPRRNRPACNGHAAACAAPATRARPSTSSFPSASAHQRGHSGPSETVKSP